MKSKSAYRPKLRGRGAATAGSAADMRGASSLVASGRSSNPVEPRQCPGPVGQPVGMGMAVGSPEGMAGKLLGRPVGMGKLDGMAGRPEGIAGKPDGIPGRAVGKP